MSPLRRARDVLAVIAIVLGIAVLAPRETAAVSACGGRPQHTLLLSSGTASPGSGSTGTRFAFTVKYADSDGCSPDRIVVVITGVGEFALKQVSGDLQAGATFASSMTLPAGRWPYSFEASSGSGPGRQLVQLQAVTPASVRVVAPTPKPTVAPTPRPTSKPTAAPTGAANLPPEPSATPSPSSPAGPTPPTRTSTPDGTAVVGAGLHGPPPPGSGSPAPLIDPRLLPRPVLALGVSSAGTLLGLWLFRFLSRGLFRSSSRSEIAAGSRRSRDGRGGLTGSRR